jgi:Ca2+-binding EF-hand superfamily protein
MIREVFDLFDTDGEGQLDEAELASAIFAMGFSSHNHEELAAIFMDRMDMDGDRRISIYEFIQLMQGHLAGRNPEEEIRSTYAAFFDTGKKEAINLSLLRKMTTELGISLSEDELSDMIEDADRNCEGGVDEEEYVHILKHSTWF